MTQPAVSRHLHTLEERFGLRLLTRGKSSQATPAGLCLADHARSLLADYDALESHMALQSTPRGRLLIGASSTPGELLLPGIAVEFSARYPEVSVDLHIADTEDTITALLNRDFELAAVGREIDDSRLECVFIEEDELIAIVAASNGLADSRVGSQDVADWPFVMREHGSATREVFERGLASVGIKPRVAMELGSNAAIAGAVAAGTGIGALPARALGSQSAVKRLDVNGLKFLRPFVLVTEVGRPLSPAAEAFARMCVDRGNS